MVYERCGILGLFRRPRGAPTTLAEYEGTYESCNVLYGGTPVDRASAPDGLACDGGITRDGACVPSDGTPCGDDARYVNGTCVPYTTCTPPMAELAPPDGASDRECACPDVEHPLGPVATDFGWCGTSRSDCDPYYV